MKMGNLKDLQKNLNRAMNKGDIDIAFNSETGKLPPNSSLKCDCLIKSKASSEEYIAFLEEQLLSNLNSNQQ